MRVASLVPGATEMVYALGLEASLVAVGAECDHPAGARQKPRAVRSLLDAGLDSAALDAEVRRRAAAGEPLYHIDADLLERMRPDVLLTQELCDVCAADPLTVGAAVDSLSYEPEIVTLQGTTLAGVLDDVRRLGRALGAPEQGASAARQLQGRLDAVAAAVADAEPVPTVLLEWLAPPMRCGHWIPDQVAAAGGRELLGESGQRSTLVEWRDVAEAAPEALVLAPCGFDAERAHREAGRSVYWEALAGTPAVREGRAFAVDGDALFSRPGPRLVDGVELLARLLHGVGVEKARREDWRAVAPERPGPVGAARGGASE